MRCERVTGLVWENRVTGVEEVMVEEVMIEKEEEEEEEIMVSMSKRKIRTRELTL